MNARDAQNMLKRPMETIDLLRLSLDCLASILAHLTLLRDAGVLTGNLTRTLNLSGVRTIIPTHTKNGPTCSREVMLDKC